MSDCITFYIDGTWVEASALNLHDLVDPATEERAGRIGFARVEDVAKAVAAARTATSTYRQSSRDERIALLVAIGAEYQKRRDDIASAISQEMGSPLGLALNAHVALGAAHIQTGIDILKNYTFEEMHGTTMIRREPIGVCGLITPWNWPMNQVAVKVIPALAVGCTIILKPSEYSASSAQIFAEICDAARVPPGVFNLIQGDGKTGAALAGHPDVDMISFTGSTRAGIAVAQAAAPGVKRVAQELGGKSPSIILEDADIASAVRSGVMGVMINSGQTCSAPTRMLVPRSRLEMVKELAAAIAKEVTVGAPRSGAMIGPLVNGTQWDRVQGLIARAMADGATLLAGGIGRPDGLDRGFYVRPTIFADVGNDMEIAQCEVFGPVLAIIAYDDEDEAIEIANDTPYGLAAYVHTADPKHGRRLARAIHAGQVVMNDAPLDFGAPFGGYKQSGNGREWGAHAFGEYLETKAIIGHG